MRAITQLVSIFILGLTAGCTPANSDTPSPEATGEAPLSAETDGNAEVDPAEGSGEGVAPAADLEPTIPPGDFEIHEWGFIHFGEGLVRLASSNSYVAPAVVTAHEDSADDEGADSADLDPEPIELSPGTTTGPVPIIDDMPALRKPIVYIVPGESFDATQPISVTISIADGHLREVWPTPGAGAQPPHESSFRWTVRVEDEPCGADLAPSNEDPACVGLLGDDVLCEAAEMASYMGTTTRCLNADGVRTPALVYNGIIRNTSRPSMQDNLLVGGVATAGPVWAFDTAGGLHRVDELAAGDSRYIVDMPTMLVTELEPQVRAELERRGLTAREADDFLGAWRDSHFGEGASETWSVMGFYEDGVVEALAPMIVTPTPSASHRVLAFSVGPSVVATVAAIALADSEGASIRLPPVLPREGFDRSTARAFVRANSDTIRQCYTDSPDPTLSGRVWVTIVAAPDGSIRRVDVESDQVTEGDARDGLFACLTETIGELALEPSGDGEATRLRFPFVVVDN